MSAIVTAIIIGTSVIATGAAGSAMTKDRPTQSPKPKKRRTREDYLGTSFSDALAKPKTNMLPYAPMYTPKPIQPVYTPQPIQPINTPQPIAPLTPATNHYIDTGAVNTQPLYNYYNDPYQVNSLADVLFNFAGRELVLEDLGVPEIDVIPDWIPLLGKADDLVLAPINYIKDTIIVGADLLKRDTIDPLFDKDRGWGEVGLNWLMGSAETLDVAANPIKGLFLDGPEGFLRGFGFGNEGRTNYEFDVNSGINLPKWIPLLGGTDVVDLGLEMLVDPLNFISFGGKGVAASGAKSAGKSLLDDVVREFAQAGIKNSDEVAEQTIKEYTREVTEQAIKGQKLTTPEFINTIRKSGLAKEAQDTILKRSADILGESALHNIISGAGKISKFGSAADDFVMNLTPVGWGFAAVRYGLNQIKTYGNALARRTYRAFTNTLEEIKYNSMSVNMPDLKNFEDAVVLEKVLKDVDAALDADNIIRQPINIDGMPTEKDLVTKYQQYEIYKEGKTIDDFIKRLKDGGDIDDIVFNKLLNKQSDEYLRFAKYYDEMIKPVGDVFVKMTDDIKTQFGKLGAVLDKVISKAKTRIDAIVKASDMLDAIYKGQFRITDLASVDSAIARTNKMIGALENIKGSAKPFAKIEAAKLNLVKLQELKTLKTSVEAKLGLKITELGNFQYFNEAFNSKDPIKFIETKIAENKTSLRNADEILKDKSVPKWDKQSYMETRAKIVADLKELSTLRKLANDPDPVIIRTNVNQANINKSVASVKTRVVRDMEFIQKYLKDFKIPKDVTDSIKQDAKVVESAVLNFIEQYDSLFDKFAADNVDAAAKISDLLMESLNYNVKNAKTALQYADILKELVDTIYYAKEFFPKKLEDSHHFLNDIVGLIETDVNNLYKYALEDLTITDKTMIYTLKNNSYVNLMYIIEQYNNNEQMRGFINAMALDNDDTVIAKLFNIFRNLDPSIAKTSVDLKAQANYLYRNAKSHYNYEVLFNTVNKLHLGKDQHIADAFMDWLAGANYQDITRFTKSISDYDGNISPDLIREALEQRINGKFLSGLNKNTTLYQVLDLGTIDKTKAHMALYDAEITAENYLKLMQENGTPLTNGYRFVSFDTETTGFYAKAGHQVTNIGATLYEVQDGKLVKIDSFDQYAKLNPNEGMNKSITELTGIKEEVLRSKYTQQQLINKFDAWYSAFNTVSEDGTIKKLPIVGHNIKKFDIPFIKTADASRSKIRFGETIDTLEVAKNMAGAYQVVPEEVLSKLTQTLTHYLNTQKQYSKQVIQLMDATAFNYMFESIRHFEDIALGRFQTLDKNIYRILNDEIVMPILGRIKGIDGNAVRDYVSEAGGEFLNRTQYLDIESFVRNLRESLSDIKQSNRLYATKYFNMEDINDDVAKHLGVDSIAVNILSYFNGRNANGDFVNEYILNQFAPKTIFRDRSGGILDINKFKGIDPIKVTRVTRNIQRNLEYAPSFKSLNLETKTDLVNMLQATYGNTDIWKLVDTPMERTVGELYAIHQTLGYRNTLGQTVYSYVDPTMLDTIDSMFDTVKNKSIDKRFLEMSSRNENIIKYMDILNDETSSPALRVEASNYIASNGLNKDQVERVYASARLIEDYVKDPKTLTDRMNRVVGIIRNENLNYHKDAIDMAEALANTEDDITKVIENNIAINETRTVFNDDLLKTIAFIEDAKAPVIVTQQWKNKPYTPQIQNIINNIELFNKHGVDVKYDDNYFALVRRADYVRPAIDPVSEVQVHALDNKSDALNHLLDTHNKSFNKYNKLRDTNSVTGSANTAVNSIDASTYKGLFEDLPEFITENSIIKDATFQTDFFVNNKSPLLNYMNIGDTSARKFADSSYQTAFRNTMTLMEKQLQRTDGASKLMQNYFNKDVSINSPAWSDLSNDELLKTFQDNNYLTVVYPTETKRGLLQVRSMTPRSIADIEFLKNIDATVVPKDMANSLISTVNVVDFKDLPAGLEQVATFWHKYIIGTYKTLYVSSPGLVFRNLNDILIKNAVGGNFNDIPTDMMSFMKAFQDWRKYQKVMQEVYRDYDSLTRNTLDAYFSVHPEFDRVWFNEIHEYATSNVTAGLAQAQQEAIKGYVQAGDTRNVAEKAFDDLMFESNILFKRNLMDFNTHIEHAGRLSKLRMDRAAGSNYYEAYGDVLRTHFDYRTKGKGTLYAETLFPFVTFPLFNLQFWLDAIKQSPWIVRNLIQVSTDSMEIEEQTQFNIDHSLKLQSAIMNGNVIIGNTIWKTNPSVYDAYNLITDPVGEFKQRLAAPIKLGVDKLLNSTGQNKFFNPEPDYVNKYDTNLDKLGFGDLEKTMNDYGLYNITRLANNVLKGVAYLGNDGNLEQTDHIADVIPSIATEYKPNYGTRIGETFSTQKIKSLAGTTYNTVQDKTGIITKSTFYPTRYPKISKTAGRSYNRIPYAKRYYSGSYNTYNRWKANRVTARSISTPASAESLQYVFKGLLYDLGMNPKIIRMYNLKQRGVYKVK